MSKATGRQLVVVGLLAVLSSLFISDAVCQLCRAPDIVFHLYSKSQLQGVSNELRRRRLEREYSEQTMPADRTFASWNDAQLARAMLEARTYYGNDDRRDVALVCDKTIRSYFDSVIALVPTAFIKEQNDHFVLRAPPLFAQGVCPHVRFWDEPAAALCTGFLVAPDVIATAAHCFDDEHDFKSDYYYVSGFRGGGQSLQRELARAQVYTGTHAHFRCDEGDGIEWALVQLDRPVAGRPVILPRRQSGTIAPATPLYVLGYPSGVPLKYAPNAAVRKDYNDGVFIANLDTFHGNSGSPVFNATDNRVEGILTEGEKDWTPSICGCTVPIVCPDSGCEGEKVVRISNVPDSFPVSPSEDLCPEPNGLIKKHRKELLRIRIRRR